MPDESKSLADGRDRAVGARRSQAGARGSSRRWRATYGIDLGTPFGKLPRKAREALLFGSGRTVRRADCRTCAAASRKAAGRSRKSSSRIGRCGRARRAAASGSSAQSLSVRVKGRPIADYVDMPIAEALRAFDDAAADRSGSDHRRADPPRDPGASAFPERRRRRLSARSAAAPRRCRAAKASESGWRRRSAPT